MRTLFRPSDLIPAEFNVKAVYDAAGAIVVAASGRSDCSETELWTAGSWSFPALITMAGW